MVKLLEELACHAQPIESLLDLCFGTNRHQKASYQFRDRIGCVNALSHVALDDDDNVVGTIRYWPIQAGGSKTLLLGPIAVHPDLHGRGIGRALVFTSLSAAESLGHDIIFLVGDLDYYSRLGFSTVPGNIVMPNEKPHRLQYRLLGDAKLPVGKLALEPMVAMSSCQKASRVY